MFLNLCFTLQDWGGEWSKFEEYVIQLGGSTTDK